MIKNFTASQTKFLFVPLFIYIFIVGLFVGQFFLSTSIVNAQSTSSTINFQGKITNSDGTNISNGSPACVQAGQDTCVFRINYYHGSSGSLIATEEVRGSSGTGVEIGDNDGVFNLSLGDSSNTFTMDAGYSTSYSSVSEMFQHEDDVYITIDFDPDGGGFSETFQTASGGRMPVRAVPYAISASSVSGGLDTVYSNDDDKTLNINDTTSGLVFSVDTSAGFDIDIVNGNFTIQDNGVTFIDFDSNGGVTVTLNGTTNPDFTIDNLGTGSFVINDESFDATPFIIDNNGDVGIGTNAPSDKVSIIDDVSASGRDVLGVTVNQQAGGVDNAGVRIMETPSNTAGDTVYGLRVEPSSGASDGTMVGISIGNLLSSGAGSELGLNIGSGWDTGLDVRSPASITSTLNVSGNTTLSTSGVTTIGAGGNTFVFDPSTGPTYSGTARPTKKVVLSPEYAGATMTTFYGAGTETDHNGTMTADVETSGELNTYYQWVSSEATLQGYTVVIRYTLPSDFGGWLSGSTMSIDFSTDSTSATDNEFDIYMYRPNNLTSAVYTSTGNVSSTAGSWSSIDILDSELDDNTGADWDDADQTVLIFLRMRSLNSNSVKIGDVVINYYAKF